MSIMLSTKTLVFIFMEAKSTLIFFRPIRQNVFFLN